MLLLSAVASHDWRCLSKVSCDQFYLFRPLALGRITPSEQGEMASRNEKVGIRQGPGSNPVSRLCDVSGHQRQRTCRNVGPLLFWGLGRSYGGALSVACQAWL